jgi:hypothetical protein
MRFKYLLVGVGILVALGIWQVRAAQKPRPQQPSVSDAGSLRQHGAYLVNAAVLCGDCHTPQNDKGMPDKGRALRGAILPIRPKKETKDWADESPNITAGGLASKWSEGEMIKFLMTGIDPEGKKARPPMPAFRFNASDARAIYLYLQSVPGASASGVRQQQREP